MSHLHTLPHDTREPSVMRMVLLDLAEKVGRRLRAEGASGRTVTLTLRSRDFTTWSRARTLEHEIDDGYELYRIGCRILDATRLSQPIRLLGIGVSGLSYGARQAWWLPEVERDQRLLEACDRLNDHFGEMTVLRATLLERPAHPGTDDARAHAAGRHYQVKRYPAENLPAQIFL